MERDTIRLRRVEQLIKDSLYEEDIKNALYKAYQLLIYHMRYHLGVFVADEVFNKMISYAKYYKDDSQVQWFSSATEQDRTRFCNAWNTLVDRIILW